MMRFVTDGNVDDYILLLIDEVLEALIDGRVQIDVPNGAAIHEDVTIEVLRLEGDWN